MSALRPIVSGVGVLIALVGLLAATGVVHGLCLPGGTGCAPASISVSFSHSVSGYTVTVRDTTASSTGISPSFRQTWFWGDGSTTGPSAWSSNPYTHSYSQAGSYTIVLDDTTSLIIGRASAVVTIAGGAPASVSISCNPAACSQYTGSELAVVAAVSPNGPYDYAWTGYPAGEASGTDVQELVLLDTTPAGSWTVTVEVTDTDSGAVVGSASQAVSFTSNSSCGSSCQPKPLSVSVSCTPSNCAPTVNESGVVVAASVSGGNGPFTATWTGSVPGLSPSATGLSLTGTPTVAGTYNLTVNVVNSADAHGTANVTVTVSQSVPCEGSACCGSNCGGSTSTTTYFNAFTGLLIGVGLSLAIFVWVTRVDIAVVGGLVLVIVLTAGGYVAGGLGLL